jgi:hypothetical protein
VKILSNALQVHEANDTQHSVVLSLAQDLPPFAAIEALWFRAIRLLDKREIQRSVSRRVEATGRTAVAVDVIDRGIGIGLEDMPFLFHVSIGHTRALPAPACLSIVQSVVKSAAGSGQRARPGVATVFLPLA